MSIRLLVLACLSHSTHAHVDATEVVQKKKDHNQNEKTRLLASFLYSMGPGGPGAPGPNWNGMAPHDQGPGPQGPHWSRPHHGPQGPGPQGPHAHASPYHGEHWSRGDGSARRGYSEINHPRAGHHPDRRGNFEIDRPRPSNGNGKDERWGSGVFDREMGYTGNTGYYPDPSFANQFSGPPFGMVYDRRPWGNNGPYPEEFDPHMGYGGEEFEFYHPEEAGDYQWAEQF